METLRRITGLAVAAFALALPTPAAAQALNPDGPPEQRGFGRRDAFVFSLERIFGFEHAEFGGDGPSHSYDMQPMNPIYWGDVGLFDVSASGLTLGALVGATHMFVPDSSDGPFGKGEDVTLVRLKPRIGYAGAGKRTLGYWLRGGPSLFAIFEGSDHHAIMTAIGAEAYAVISPVPHFVILAGPTFDIGVYGRNDNGDSLKLTEYGLSTGIAGELW